MEMLYPELAQLGQVCFYRDAVSRAWAAWVGVSMEMLSPESAQPGLVCCHGDTISGVYIAWFG